MLCGKCGIHITLEQVIDNEYPCCDWQCPVYAKCERMMRAQHFGRIVDEQHARYQRFEDRLLRALMTRGRL